MSSPRFLLQYCSFYAVHAAFQLGQLVVVGGKQSLAAKALGGVCNVLHYGAGNTHTVKGGSAAADLVQHHKAFGGGIFRISATSVISTIKVD